jgi:hypothetical protein
VAALAVGTEALYEIPIGADFGFDTETLAIVTLTTLATEAGFVFKIEGLTIEDPKATNLTVETDGLTEAGRVPDFDFKNAVLTEVGAEECFGFVAEALTKVLNATNPTLEVHAEGLAEIWAVADENSMLPEAGTITGLTAQTRFLTTYVN